MRLRPAPWHGQGVGIWTIPTAGSAASGSPVRRRHACGRGPSRGRTGLFVSAYPRVASGVYLAVGLVAAPGLGLTPLALLLAGIVFAAAALAYTEGVSMFPDAGGAAALARHAFGELASFVTGWATCLGLVAAAALAALFAAQYLSVFWSPLGSGGWAAAGAVAVLGMVAAAAILGVERSLRLGSLLGVLDLSVQVLLLLLGLVFVCRPEQVRASLEVGSAPSVGRLLLAFAVASVAYAGMESIGDLPVEARDPERDVRPATAALLASAPLGTLGLALVALMAMPVVPGAHAGATTLLVQGPPHGYRDYPMLGIVDRVPLPVLATGLRYLVALPVAVALVALASAALRRCGQVAGWLGEHHQLPPSAATRHPQLETPHRALAVAAAAAIVLAIAQDLRGGLGLVAEIWAYAALAALTLVQVAVIWLRLTDPGRYRPFAVPIGLPIYGRRLPPVAIAGALATATGWIAVFTFAGAARDVATASLLAGLAGYAAYRRHLGLSLTERTQREAVAAVGPGIEVEFQTMLIPVNTAGDELPADVVEVAVQLAAERRASLVVLAFTEIPLGEEMNMEIDGLDGSVERLAVAARAIGEPYGIRVHTTHLRTRDAAEAILAEAARRGSQVILLGANALESPPRRRLAYDHVVRRVLADATQRVMIIRPQQAVRA
jgi:basic amino acid/polyamine antiporter, APA family